LLEVFSESFTIDPVFDPKRYASEAFCVTWEQPVTVIVRFSDDQEPFVRECQRHPT
jgi:hypothetical protein